tara:strand:- start:2410 stop:3159 length:750 start_codon:yes stop_codon:yes gene_type:complete
MGKETQFKDHLRNTSSELRTNVGATWASAVKAPMLLHTPGEEVTRKNPFRDGEEMTYTPEPKFSFVSSAAFDVAASGAMQHGYMQLADKAAIYRTWCPTESDKCMALPNFTPGAKMMLSHFLQSYAAECATYARYVRTSVTKPIAKGSKEREPTSGRISSKTMAIGMEIAEDKVFGGASLTKAQLFAGPDKVSKKKAEEGDGAQEGDAKKKKKKEKKAPKEKTPKAVDGAQKTIKKAKKKSAGPVVEEE